MAGLPLRRPPPVSTISPRDVIYQTVGFDKVCIPVNAVIVTEKESIFLETARNLEDLKAVLIERVGYVYFGKIHCRLVFLLKPRGPTAVIQGIKKLKPKAAIFLGFCKSLQMRPSDSQSSSFEAGDVIIAETVIRKSQKHGKLESFPCSEYLVNVFENGKFGWSPPKYRGQSVHVGSVVQMGDLAKNDKGNAMAEKTTNLDVLECCKDLDNEWISILGVIATRRYHNSSSWEQYVAAVLGSFVTKVLQDDQVFAVLGGEGPEPREHSSLSCFPEQESVSLTAYQVSTGCDISQEQVQKQAELHWAQIRGAYGKGLLHTSQLMRRTQSEIAIQNAGHRMSSFCKNPVENVEEKNAIEDCAQASTDRTSHSIETENRLSFEGEHGVTLPPIPSNIAGITARALQRTMSDHSRASQPCLASSMAVSMQAALLPLGASLQNQGGRLEIISVTSEDRTPVRRQGRILPPITLGQNKI